MQYMLIMLEDKDVIENRDGGANRGQYWGAWTAYLDAIRASGIIISGNGLQSPSTATTVRVRDGKRQIQDGPFADTKEQLGGYFVIDVPDLDAALEWAARSPAALSGSVEVRPVMVMS